MEGVSGQAKAGGQLISDVIDVTFGRLRLMNYSKKA